MADRCSGCGHSGDVHDTAGFCWVAGCACTRKGTYTAPGVLGRVVPRPPSRA